MLYVPFLTKNLEILNSLRPRQDGKDKKLNHAAEPFIYLYTLCGSRPSSQPTRPRPSRPRRNLENNVHCRLCIFYWSFFDVYSYSTFYLADSTPPKAEWAENRRPFGIFDSKFTNWRCRSSIVDWLIKVALSACRCRVQLFNRKCRIIDERNVMALSFSALTPVPLGPKWGNSE
jgi:hypothetical protein